MTIYIQTIFVQHKLVQVLLSTFNETYFICSYFANTKDTHVILLLLFLPLLASPRSPLSLVWYHCPMVLFCIVKLQACDPPPLHFSNNPSLPLFSFCTNTVFMVGESCVGYIQGNGVHFNNTHKAKT